MPRPANGSVKVLLSGEKVGVWLIGACGGVGSTTAIGVAALKRGIAPRTGLVGDLPVFASAGLVDPASLVIGGHEVRAETLLEAVESSHRRANLFDPPFIRRCAAQLNAFQTNVKSGTLYGAGPMIRRMADRPMLDRDRSAAEAVERLTADIVEFRKRRRLDRVIVVHIASSEPPFSAASVPARFDRLRALLARRGAKVLPTSSLYALAAMEAECPYVNFTPSLGVNVPALRRRAEALGLPYMGNDGKTGETLVKSALAPMFARRNLRVLSWVGQNILGNRDGEVLNDPRTRESKIRAKDGIIARIVGGSPTTRVRIDYVPSLDDWKVAWDFIHFEGFLGARMNMQFTWHGSDSILAAPLVIDLARFAALEQRRGGQGPMRHLAFFFKDPIDVKEHDLFTQWNRLVDHVTHPSPRSK